MNDDFYAQVFVSSSLDRESLTQLLCGFSDDATRARFSEVNTKDISVDVRNNEDYDPEKTEFINYRYYIDVNPFIGVDYGCFLNSLAKLVAFIKKQNFPVVTACDDETLLAQLVDEESKK